MTRRRWIADEVAGDTAALVGEHAAHLSRVLRARIGQEFDIATATGVRSGTITAISDERVEFALGEERALTTVPAVSLILAIFKFDRMEWAIEKCTEIGVTRIVPVIASRTDTHLATAASKRRERWQRIARQGAEQSRRATPPEIAAPVKLKELLAAGGELRNLNASVEARLAASPRIDSSARVVLAESENDIRLRDALHADSSSVLLAVGPEGGWTDNELRSFRDAGWVAASLGDTILRAETAAIVASALALDALS